jgi:hypothetical protein
MSKAPLLSRWASHRLSPTFILLGVGLLGLLARIWVVKHSLGSNDMLTWWSFATEIDQHGLGFVYDNDPRFNHPPLMGLLGYLLHAAAAKTGVRFDVLFKTPQLLADAGVAALLYWMWQRRSARYAALAVALFCWNPASLLVSAYHGNTDPLCAALALVAVLLVDSKRPLLAGLALGASINVKLIPLLLVPALYSCVCGWRQAARFTVGLSFGVLPFVPVALWHWPGFSAHVLTYNSFPGIWGITSILTVLKSNANLGALLKDLHVMTFWVENGSRLVLLATLVLGGVNLARGRPWSARELGACAFSVFLVLTPGFGVQYIVYPVALLFAANLTRAVAFSTIAGFYAFVLYFSLWTQSQPFYSDFYVGHPMGAQVVGYLAWMVLIRTVVDLLRARRPPPPLAAETQLNAFPDSR